MVGEIAGALTALRSASEVVKILMDTRDAALVNAQAGELYRHIVHAHISTVAAEVSEAALVQRIKMHEKQLAGTKEWEAVKGRYRLGDMGTGAFVYVHAPEPDGKEPTHWLCARCFDERKRSVLQYNNRTADRGRVYVCPTCRGAIVVHGVRSPGMRWSR